MTNLLVIALEDEAKAVAASGKLFELEAIGDITVYDKAIVRKNYNGSMEELLVDTEDGLRTATGMAVGTMMGVLGGPVGMVAGMLAGATAGAMAELEYFSFSEDFIDKAAQSLEPGKVAIVAEVDEDNSVFVDTTLAPLGAIIWRSDLEYAYDKYDEEQIEAIDEEIAEERAELKMAIAGEKEKIQKKIDSLKAKRQKILNDMREKIREKANDGKEAVKAAGDRLVAPVKEYKVSSLKRRIEKYQAKVQELQSTLSKMDS